MKNFFLTITFLISTALVFSQSYFNFVGIGFSYCDITDKNLDIVSLLKSGPVGNVMTSEGFNHFEINLVDKTFTHRYSGDEEGVKEISKINNLSKTKDYVKFNVKTNNFGYFTCIISLNPNFKSKFIVKYEDGNKTEVAFY